ncbi:MAG TPA: nitroreductase family deazaflavin-dependent oxidoreductase [Actinocrinis sp.]|nr:nitroreductase family deazaflavin-dependent oxidoreductase [Actinocrinis sp.]
MSEANDWNNGVIKEFRENGGKVGGMFEGATMIIVHAIGAKSGKVRETPLVYFGEGDRIFIYASKGGAPENPAWYHNLVANPQVKVEVGTETFEVTARELAGAERDEYYAKQVEVMPGFGDYAANTTRVIPVFELVRA